MDEHLYNGVCFGVDKSGALRSLTAKEYWVDDVYIPHILPDGTKINALGDDFVEDRFNKIVVDDEIASVFPSAFSNSVVREVHWPSSCRTIPEFCFSHSSVLILSNIDGVTSIGDAAFYYSGIQEFNWPANCEKVPDSCFAWAELKEITNMHNVNDICSAAFANTALVDFIWPSGCEQIPPHCFRGCVNLEHVYNIGCISRIGERAFDGTKSIEKIDLSLTTCFIDDYAFLGIPRERVTVPYYIEDRDSFYSFGFFKEAKAKKEV